MKQWISGAFFAQSIKMQAITREGEGSKPWNFLKFYLFRFSNWINCPKLAFHRASLACLAFAVTKKYSSSEEYKWLSFRGIFLWKMDKFVRSMTKRFEAVRLNCLFFSVPLILSSFAFNLKSCLPSSQRHRSRFKQKAQSYIRFPSVSTDFYAELFAAWSLKICLPQGATRIHFKGGGSKHLNIMVEMRAIRPKILRNTQQIREDQVEIKRRFILWNKGTYCISTILDE